MWYLQSKLLKGWLRQSVGVMGSKTFSEDGLGPPACQTARRACPVLAFQAACCSMPQLPLLLTRSRVVLGWCERQRKSAA